MGIEKMSQLTVEGNIDKLDSALMLCCESKMFQISDNGGTISHGISEQNPYESAYSKIREIARTLDIKPALCSFEKVTQQTAGEFLQYCENISERFNSLKKEYIDLSKELEEHRQTDTYVKHLIGLDVSFQELFNMKYVSAKIGRLPAENLQKLQCYTNKCLEFIPFESNDRYVWGVYLAPKSSLKAADMVMNMLFFEAAALPDYLDTNAATADVTLEHIIADEERLKKEIEEKLEACKTQHSQEILMVMSKLKYLYDCFELRKKALIDDGRFFFSGYCPTKQCKELSSRLTELDSVVTVEVPVKGRLATENVPVKLKNNIIFRPFEMFVKMYGLPEYSTFDPTPYVAVTYMLMFGIMFGDVGQGLVISLFGLLGTKFLKNGLFPIMTRIGLFSAAFGVLYGSVFGIETIIEPFFHRENIWRLLGYTEQPHNIFQVATILLIAALVIGIVLVTISMTFNTVLNFRKRKWGEALFSVNGVAGLVFYISLVAGVGGMFMLGINLFNPAYIICLIVLPLALIFFKHPLSDLISGTKHSEKISVGNFIIENFIELFEAALSFLSNTMSFLRIGGFILSHAGMMLVVAQLAGTNAEGAEWTVGTVITYIIGNLIVMGIEGLLVGIQVLRLEFYEIFNRFYSGNGKSFCPIDINLETET